MRAMPSADTHQALRAALEKALAGDPKLEAALKAVDEVFPSSAPAAEPKKHQSANDAFEEARQKLVDARRGGDAGAPSDKPAEGQQEPAAA